MAMSLRVFEVRKSFSAKTPDEVMNEMAARMLFDALLQGGAFTFEKSKLYDEVMVRVRLTVDLQNAVCMDERIVQAIDEAQLRAEQQERS